MIRGAAAGAADVPGRPQPGTHVPVITLLRSRWIIERRRALQALGQILKTLTDD
jgi:hypothetical protein